MIVDCTMFHWEFDLLEIRMRELWDVVDYFYVTESVCDHRGNDRDLVLSKNIDKFDWAKEKLVVVVSDKPKNAATSWDYEKYQRLQSVEACKNIVQDDDLILISDVDEIMNAKSVTKANKIGGIFTMKMPMFYYYMNLYVEDWGYPKAITYKYLEDPNALRLRDPSRTAIMENAGWHFSYLGTPDQISHKIKTFAHEEYDKKDFTDIDKITESIHNKKDIFKRSDKSLTTMGIGHLPKYVLDNIERYDSFILKSYPHS